MFTCARNGAQGIPVDGCPYEVGWHTKVIVCDVSRRQAIGLL